MVSTWVQLKRFQDNKLCKFREICCFSHQILHFWILLKLLQELQEFWSEKQLTLLITFQMLVYPCTATKGNKLSSADNTALILPNSPDDTHITLNALIIENEYELKGSTKPPANTIFSFLWTQSNSNPLANSVICPNCNDQQIEIAESWPSNIWILFGVDGILPGKVCLSLQKRANYTTCIITTVVR